MNSGNFDITGLNSEQVTEARLKYGYNRLSYKKENAFFIALKKFIKDPMVILLLVASSIYFISGKTGDGIFLASAIILVSAISFYQDSRSRNALATLKDFTKPHAKVVRNGKITEVRSEELVVGDSMLVEEGAGINADGIIIHSNDFSVNESILTGESLAVEKDITKVDRSIYQGTTVVRGTAIAAITAIGGETKLGKIGKSLENIQEEKTPLEVQINNFVKKMVFAGFLVFIIVWSINFYHSKSILDSLLKSLTLAMSILPEEIPVAFTTFMALGSWRLMKMGIVVKQMKTVETLGSATIICTDKTGTITENRMSLAKLFSCESNKISNLDDALTVAEKEVITLAMWSSEPLPFDPMEVALHDAYSKLITIDERTNYKMVHEYALSGKPPMMTHVFENAKNNRIIAAKGAPEAIMNVSDLTSVEQRQLENIIQTFAKNGYRVLAVGEAHHGGNNLPATQQEFKFTFKGIIAFYDPPKKNIETVLKHFDNAGISVKIVTGDNAETTAAIAKQIGFKGYEKNISGDELMQLSTDALHEKVISAQVFTRMFPEAKLKIINALKEQQEIVAMTGDGVNDGPALKAAHIGIAMGKKGTEIAKQAASLILLNDDLSQMVDAVAMGRKIYSNLKKAIQYIISIHIPIILTVFIPLTLGWIYPTIFSPVHIIFLELIMGPTCSIIYENEPLEPNAMNQKPRAFSVTFFNRKELITSIIQGLIITAGSLTVYQYAVFQGYSEALTRTMIFAMLITANIFLTLVNRSFYYSILRTLNYKNNLVAIIISLTVVISGLFIFVKPLAIFFEFESLTFAQLIISVSAGFVFVIWFEIVKWLKRKFMLE
jgi:Ca2+-transporting ATPase